jgi:hypothetical protein
MLTLKILKHSHASTVPFALTTFVLKHFFSNGFNILGLSMQGPRAREEDLVLSIKVRTNLGRKNFVRTFYLGAKCVRTGALQAMVK